MHTSSIITFAFLVAPLTSCVSQQRHERELGISYGIIEDTTHVLEERNVEVDQLRSALSAKDLGLFRAESSEQSAVLAAKLAAQSEQAIRTHAQAKLSAQELRDIATEVAVLRQTVATTTDPAKFAAATSRLNELIAMTEDHDAAIAALGVDVAINTGNIAENTSARHDLGGKAEFIRDELHKASAALLSVPSN